MNCISRIKLINAHSRLLTRTIFCTAFKAKVVPENLKGKSKGSQEWLNRRVNDPYVKFTRYENYRCRSAFKLLQIDEKHKFLRPGQAVVDCGAAPGSWTQIVVKKLNLNEPEAKGTAIAIDLQPMDPIRGAVVLGEMDVTKRETQDHILTLLPDGKADVVLSDMAPKATGIKDIDKISITNLVYSVLKLCTIILKKNGVLLCKTWNCGKSEEVIENLKLLFDSVKIVKPSSSYIDSSEIFFLCKGFKQLPKKPNLAPPCKEITNTSL